MSLQPFLAILVVATLGLTSYIAAVTRNVRTALIAPGAYAGHSVGHYDPPPPSSHSLPPPSAGAYYLAPSSSSSATPSVLPRFPLAAPQGTLPTALIASPSFEKFSYQWRRNLGLGLKNHPDIHALQKALQLLGFYSGHLNGNFTGETQRAVQVFQRQYKIRPTGYVGKATRQKLNNLFRRYITQAPPRIAPLLPPPPSSSLLLPPPTSLPTSLPPPSFVPPRESTEPPPSSAVEPRVASTISPPTVDLKVNGQDGPVVVVGHVPLNLSWTTTHDPTTCNEARYWSNKDPRGGSETITLPYPEHNVTFTLQCFNTAGSATDTVKVVMNPDMGLGQLPPELPTPSGPRENNGALDVLVYIDDDSGYTDLTDTDARRVLALADRLLFAKTGLRIRVMDVRHVAADSVFRRNDSVNFMGDVVFWVADLVAREPSPPEAVIILSKGDRVNYQVSGFGNWVHGNEYFWNRGFPRSYCNEFELSTLDPGQGDQNAVGIVFSTWHYWYGHCGYEPDDTTRSFRKVSEVAIGGECRNQAGARCVMRRDGRFTICEDSQHDLGADLDFVTASNVVHELLHIIDVDVNFHWGSSQCNPVNQSSLPSDAKYEDDAHFSMCPLVLERAITRRKGCPVP